MSNLPSRARSVFVSVALIVVSMAGCGVDAKAQSYGDIGGSEGVIPSLADPEAGGVVAPVPEPLTMSLLGIGGVGLVIASRRRREEKAEQA